MRSSATADGPQERPRALVFQTMASVRQDQRVTLSELTGQLVSGIYYGILLVVWVLPYQYDSPSWTSVTPPWGSPALLLLFSWIWFVTVACSLYPGKICGVEPEFLLNQRVGHRVESRRAGLCPCFSYWLTMTSGKSPRYLPGCLCFLIFNEADYSLFSQIRNYLTVLYLCCLWKAPQCCVERVY